MNTFITKTLLISLGFLLTACTIDDSEIEFPDLEDTVVTCEQAQSNRLEAQNAYEADLENDELCQLYRLAIELELQICEEPNEELQDILSGLMCGQTAAECDLATTTADNARTAYEDAQGTDQEAVACTTYWNALAAQIEACGDEDGSIAELMNNLPCNDNETCNNAETATEEAQQAYDADDSQANCQAYVEALEYQIQICGDADGSLQAILNSLDCTNNNEDCNNAEMITETAQQAYDADDSQANCEAYVDALETQIQICGDADGSLQAILNGLDCTGGNTGGENGFIQLTLNNEVITFVDIQISEEGEYHVEAVQTIGNITYALDFWVPQDLLRLLILKVEYSL